MQDANPVCAFSGGRARSSVLGVRPSALIRYQATVFEKPAHGVCKMQDADPTGAFSGTRLGPRYPAFGYGGM